ncbi:MAG TPA: DinB family protein [Acidobacteriota bacterium]|jgi:uncharacterized damage-inducible protein DinB
MATVSPHWDSYTRRILDLLGSQDPIVVQEKTARKLRKAVEDLSPSQLGWNPAAGKWSIRQIIAHLVDTEIVYGYRLRKTLCDPGVAIEPFDQDVWAQKSRYENHSVQDDLNYLEALKAANLDFYRRLSPAEWKIHWMHAERGKESIEHTCKMIAGHDLNHMAQVEAIRKKILAE